MDAGMLLDLQSRAGQLVAVVSVIQTSLESFSVEEWAFTGAARRIARGTKLTPDQATAAWLQFMDLCRRDCFHCRDEFEFGQVLAKGILQPNPSCIDDGLPKTTLAGIIRRDINNRRATLAQACLRNTRECCAWRRELPGALKRALEAFANGDQPDAGTALFALAEARSYPLVMSVRYNVRPHPVGGLPNGVVLPGTCVNVDVFRCLMGNAGDFEVPEPPTVNGVAGDH